MGDIMEFKLDMKGRGVLPRAVRERAGFTEVSHLVVHAEGQGRVVIESREAIQQSIWEGAPQNPADAVAAIREDRQRDVAISDANFERRHGREALASADPEAGKRLLDFLDL